MRGGEFSVGKRMLRAIQRATRSPDSHMGLILFRGGKPFVFEASSTVRFTALNKWIARGTGHSFVVKRLRNASQKLDPAVRAKMRERYGSNVPLNEPVISPVAMFQSDLLATVAEQ